MAQKFQFGPIRNFQIRFLLNFAGTSGDVPRRFPPNFGRIHRAEIFLLPV